MCIDEPRAVLAAHHLRTRGDVIRELSRDRFQHVGRRDDPEDRAVFVGH
jgi:hypothetical protein